MVTKTRICPCRGCTKAYEQGREDAQLPIRELHKPMNGPADDITCSACAVDENNYPEYPCPTIKALDGERL